MQLGTYHPPARQSPACSSFLQAHKHLQHQGARDGATHSQGKPPSKKKKIKKSERISGRGKKQRRPTEASAEGAEARSQHAANIP